jgi:D-xylulose reductase
MRALVLEKVKQLGIREIELNEVMGPEDVTIKVHTVGICGSDVHYYDHGGIGNFLVKEPMVLGHEASGTVVSVGKNVRDLKPGDRVCMEPGIPDRNSNEFRTGRYNIDPKVRFWATPPIHGCLRPTVVHPADFTFKLPDNVSFGEGALVEPLAVGVYAVERAAVKLGSTVLVIGAGTIGLVTALAAAAAGAGKVIVADISQKRLDLCGSRYPSLVLLNVAAKPLKEALLGFGAIDFVFEASGAPPSLQSAMEAVAPGGCIVQIGCPLKESSFSVSLAQSKEVRLEFIFRYAHVYPKVVALLASGKLNAKPLITREYTFEEGARAFEEVSKSDEMIKAQILMPQ